MGTTATTTEQSNGQVKGNANAFLLGPETSIGDALAAVGANRITQEQCSEWLAERERVAVAQAEKAVKRSGGNGNSLSVKIGNAGGVVMSGGLVSAAPFRPINLAPNKVLGIILQGAKIVTAIEQATLGGTERVETKTEAISRAALAAVRTEGKS